MEHIVEFGQLHDYEFPFNYYVQCSCGIILECYDLIECEGLKKIHLDSMRADMAKLADASDLKSDSHNRE